MRDSFRPRKSFGGSRPGSGGGRNNFRDRNSGRKEMFDAVCDQCGKNCKVPFRPTQGKPIYCSECFETVDKNRDEGNFNDVRSFKRGSKNTSSVNNCEQSISKLETMLSEINDKLDQILSTLQK